MQRFVFFSNFNNGMDGTHTSTHTQMYAHAHTIIHIEVSNIFVTHVCAC